MPLKPLMGIKGVYFGMIYPYVICCFKIKHCLFTVLVMTYLDCTQE